MKGGIYEELDPKQVERIAESLGLAFMNGSRSTMRHFATSDAVSPASLVAATVRAHLLGAASMLAATKPPVDPILLATWLIEALGDAIADVAAEAPVAGADGSSQ